MMLMKGGTLRKFLFYQILILFKLFFSWDDSYGQSGSNPIFRNNFTADPSPLVFKDRLYVYVGHDQAKDGEMFTMTEWLCYSTADMRNWTYHGPIMKPADFNWGAADAWAAQVVEKEGKFYLYVTVTGKSPYGGRNIGVAISESPTGPFVDAKGSPLVRDNMTNNGKTWDDIDPTVLIDDDGQAYLSWGNPICYFAKLKPNMIELDGPIGQITPPNYAEGPWLHKRNGIYYLTYPAFIAPVGSEQMCYSTATNINGPWTHRGIISGAAKNSYTIHPGIVEFKGQWYFFYHNATLTLNGEGPALGRRSVCVEHLCYNPDGTIRPILQTTAGVTVDSPCPSDVISQVPFTGIPLDIPGRIEAEDFDRGGKGVAFHEMNSLGNQGGAAYRNEDVDIESASDTTGTYTISYNLKGEWLEYTVDVKKEGLYQVHFRIATPDAGKTMHIEINDTNVTGPVTVPNTGGWQNWQTAIIDGIHLSSGKQVLRMVFDADYINLNFFEFVAESITGGYDSRLSDMPAAYPNPFQKALSITIDGPFYYQLFSTAGEIINDGPGENHIEFKKEIPKGMYFLKVQQRYNTQWIKLIKE